MHHAQENPTKRLTYCIFTAEGRTKGTRRRKAWTEGRKDQGTGEGADWGSQTQRATGAKSEKNSSKKTNL